MSYCRLCGTLLTGQRMFASACRPCAGFQRAVEDLAEEYPSVPAATREALLASLKQYDGRSGRHCLTDKAQTVRASLAHLQRREYEGAFRLPSQVRGRVDSLKGWLLEMLLRSGLLPEDLAHEIQSLLKVMDTRTALLTRVLTFQQDDLQWCAFVEGQIDEYALGKTELDALEQLYQAHPELRLPPLAEATSASSAREQGAEIGT